MTRLPRFQRTELETILTFTPRDVAILRMVAIHRFLRSSQVAALVGGSRQQVLRRLQLLFHHGFVERPRCQIDYYHRGGSRELVYAMTRQGSQQLTRLTDFPPEWLPPPVTEVKRLYLEHALMVSDLAVTLERSQSEAVHFLHEHELKLPARLAAGRQPFLWGVNVTPEMRVGLQPDKVFALQSSDEVTPAVFFLEADRGTMPVTRAGLSQSSFFRKLLAYQATWTQGVHRSRFGFPRFRVLTVTSSPERVRHLVEACQRLERGHRLFLFTDLNSFTKHPDPFTAPLVNGKGEADSLFATKPAKGTSHPVSPSTSLA